MLDKTENKTEEIVKEKSEQKDKDMIYFPISPEYIRDLREITADIDKSRKIALSEIEKDAKSFFTNKKTLSYILNLVNLSHEMAKISLTSAYALENMQRRQEFFEQVITILASEEKKSRKMSKRNTKKFTDVEKEQQELDEIFAKMDIQKKKETLEAFKRIDKARLDLLRDAIV